MFYDCVETPIGWLGVQASDEAITAVDFDADMGQMGQGNALTALCKQQLLEYFAGQRRDFDLPLAARGTSFQHSVWQALVRIPFGTTCCYQDIADVIGNRKAVRAVGAANGSNPIPIIVPCHRVIGRDGSLIGFGGGLPRKEWLLRHEGALLL
ncbi:MAG TPA: methylated-DNA--[protein]-cysteine S-methyltransferase [Dongiaceae bacterium]|nr:methylated-DNA--[protein]-cysteine S-methyltransferase [Dongiaceae bacterium]